MVAGTEKSDAPARTAQGSQTYPPVGQASQFGDGQSYSAPPLNTDGPPPPPAAPSPHDAPPPPAGAPPPFGYPAGPPPTGSPAPGVTGVPLNAVPIPGMPIRAPLVPPQPGQVVVGYEVYRPQPGCFQCDGLSTNGIIAVIALLFLFWPLAWIPCVMPECFDDYQRPVYGWPQQPQPMPQHSPNWQQ